MSKFKLINMLDSLFLSIVTFLIIFAWIQFFLKQIFLSLFLSAILSIALILIFRWLRLKKHIKEQSKSTSSIDLLRFKLAIQTMPTRSLAGIIKKLIPESYAARTNKEDLVFIKNTQTHIFTFYYSNILTESKLLELIKHKKTSNLTIFCSSFDKDVKGIASAFKNIKITLVNIEELYKIFTQHNLSVDSSHIDLNKSKITIKEILKNSLSRHHAKGYFVSGLILLFTSLIIPYKVYYVVFSSALFILSLTCKLSPTQSNTKSIFD